jgi:hypothetical protein
MRKVCIIVAVLILAWLGTVAASNIRKSPDPNKPGSFSSWLSLSLECKALPRGQDYEFVVRLDNKSGMDIKVMINDKSLEGVIRITAKNGERYELYGQDYRRLLLTSVWPDPDVPLSRDGRITCRLRLSDWRTVLDRSIGGDIVRGGQVLVERIRVAVIVPGQGVISDNASQISPTVKIP